jgi:hypothetical protein
MPNAEKEMVQLPANVCQDCKGILTLNASLNAQLILNALIIGRVFKTSAKTHAQASVAEMLSVRYRTTIQTVGAILGTQEIHSEHAI